MEGKSSSGKVRLSVFMLFMLILSSLVIYAIVSGELISPKDNVYVIRDGNVRSADYLFFEVNGTPGHANARIDNITLWTNISGTWQANFTNGTIGAINTIVNRIFNSTDTNIIESILTDNLVFIWGAQVCDNKTVYTEESVNLDAFGTIFDNTSLLLLKKSLFLVLEM